VKEGGRGGGRPLCIEECPEWRAFLMAISICILYLFPIGYGNYEKIITGIFYDCTTAITRLTMIISLLVTVIRVNFIMGIVIVAF
jgi:hypothetical protein